jgi:hypothetical protein
MSTLETNLIQPATGTTLTVGASGDTIDIPSGATLDSTGATITGALTQTPAFRVYMDGDQSISGASTATLEMDAETFDTNSAFNTTTYKFVVPTGGDGKYFFNFVVYIAGLGQILTQAVLNWEENGSAKTQIYRPGIMDTVSRDGTIQGSMITGEMVATDEAYLQCYVATTRTITGASSFFAGNKLIGV